MEPPADPRGKAARVLVVFDMDGVLVDVRQSYYRTVIEVVRRFTGRRVTQAGVHRWKRLSGYNDEWRLATDWIRSLGGRATYAEVSRECRRIYLGRRFDGNIVRERPLVAPAVLRRLSRRFELAVFTGRPRKEALYTLEKLGVRRLFRRIVAAEDVRRQKPDPEGLLRILRGRDPRSALYLGDNVDDAIAARRAGVPFLGVLPLRGDARRLRAAGLRRLGALDVLGSARDLERRPASYA